MPVKKHKKIVTKKSVVKKQIPVTKSSNNMALIALGVIGLAVIVWKIVPTIFGKPGEIDLIKEREGFVQPRHTVLGEWTFSDPNEIGPGKSWNVLGGATFKRSEAGIVTLSDVTPTSRLVNRGLNYTIMPFRGQKKQLIVSVTAAVIEESKLRTTSKFGPVERDIEMKVQLLGPKNDANEQVDAEGERLTKIDEKVIKIKANTPMSTYDFTFDGPLNRTITMIRLYPVTSAKSQPDNKKYMGASMTKVDVDLIRVKEVSMGGLVEQGETPIKGKLTVEGVVTKMGVNSYSINNSNGKLLYSLQGNFENRKSDQVNRTAPQGSQLPYIPIEKYLGKTVKIQGEEQKGIIPGLTVLSINLI